MRWTKCIPITMDSLDPYFAYSLTHNFRGLLDPGKIRQPLAQLQNVYNRRFSDKTVSSEFSLVLYRFLNT